MQVGVIPRLRVYGEGGAYMVRGRDRVKVRFAVWAHPMLPTLNCPCGACDTACASICQCPYGSPNSLTASHCVVAPVSIP